MAVAESLMNIAASDLLHGLKRIRLSCNWMTAIVRVPKSIFLFIGATIQVTRQVSGENAFRLFVIMSHTTDLTFENKADRIQ